MSNINDFVIKKGRLMKYIGSEIDVVIPDGVTGIDGWGFNSCNKSIKSIIIPDGVTHIGNYVFEGFISLTNISIPNSVTSIGIQAFHACKSLASIIIPNSVTSIENFAFCGCSSLKEIVIPEGVTSIGNFAFSDCKNLTSVLISNGVTNIGMSAFEYCDKLTSVTIPDSVTSIEDFAFRGCSSLKEIVIPESVTSIGKRAFEGCAGLTNVTIEGKVTSVGVDVFDGCNLKCLYIKNPDVNVWSKRKLMIPASIGFILNREQFKDEDIVKKYEKYVLSQKKNLLPVIFENDIVDGVAIYTDSGIVTVKNFEEEFLLPAQQANATQCIVYLLDWKNKRISQEAEDKRFEKQLVKDPFNVADMKKLWSYKKLKNGTLAITGYKGEEVNIVIPERIGKDSVTEISAGAFYYTYYAKTREAMEKIQSVIIPEGIKVIDNYAFKGCTSLKNVTIPDSVNRKLGEEAFCDCTSLTSIVIPKGIKVIGERAFKECTSLASVTISNRLTKIGSRAFAGCNKLADSDGFVVVHNTLFGYIGNCGDIIIPDDVKIIDYRAFDRCTSLTGVTFPESVTTIDGLAFMNCTSLTNVKIPDSVTSIDKTAFSDCSNLTIRCSAGSYAETYAKENGICTEKA